MDTAKMALTGMKMERVASKSRLGALFAVALAAVAMGGIVGALTNAVNGALSPIYFVNILHWEFVGNVWRAAIAQGVFEGLIYGAIFAVIFTLVLARVSAAQAPFGFGARYLLRAAGIALASWCAGGVLAMALILLSPEFYRSTFIGVPSEFPDMLKYAWVGGSIWGVMFGAVLSVVMIPVLAASEWRARRTRPTAPEHIVNAANR